MATELRSYQRRAVSEVGAAMHRVRSVCLVAPTGSGKSVMARAVIDIAVQRGRRVLFLAHRRELIEQAAQHCRSALPAGLVGEIRPGAPSTPSCPVQVASIQTLLARGQAPPADLVVWDECHHVAADTYADLLARYPDSYRLGLTATPQRADGRPLGDMFDGMVVASPYSELLREGHLVDCRVFQPNEALEPGELARDPLVSWQELAQDRQTFAFTSRVEQCEELAARFNTAGIPSSVIEANTNAMDRTQRLRDFRDGKLTVLWNVYALTEGVDVPAASCVLLARPCGHAGMYLQICGRVLRPAPGKTDALLIDLCGSTLVHGFPTEDREYSLDGSAIKRTSPTPVRVCPRCGASFEGWLTRCPSCGFEQPKQEAPRLIIYSQELREVFRGADTDEQSKRAELARLMAVGRERQWSLYFVQKEYRKLFGTLPILRDATEEEKRAEIARLRALQQQKGWKPGFVKVRFKEMFGEWPRNGL